MFRKKEKPIEQETLEEAINEAINLRAALRHQTFLRPALEVLVEELIEPQGGGKKVGDAVETIMSGGEFELQQWSDRPSDGGTILNRWMVERDIDGDGDPISWSMRLTFNGRCRGDNVLPVDSHRASAEVITGIVMEKMDGNWPRVRWPE